MGSVCNLEVDVNGEEVFMVDKEILSSFSGRLSKLFGKSMASTTMTVNLKVIFHDFPGGPEAFELMGRFCYSHGGIPITPTNACLLHCVAHFMEMPVIEQQTENILQGLNYWTWSEVLSALKQCQNHFPTSVSSGVLKKCLDSLVARLASAIDSSPSSSSPDSISFRFSCDTRSTGSSRNGYHKYWWFEDLVGLNTSIIEKMVETMVSLKFDQVIISRFLFYYLKSQVSAAKSNYKPKIIETVVYLLHLLDGNSVSCKGLFDTLRVSLGVNISSCCRSRLEIMIGSQLDRASLDNLLVPPPLGVNYLYDVNLVLRFLKSFLSCNDHVSSTRLKRVGRLIDMYIAEVAPDSCLKPSKFLSLMTALPDSARDAHDGIYSAVDMYLEVHAGLPEKEKAKICRVFNFEKLSPEACKHLAENPKFPSTAAIQALLYQQSKLKSLLQDTDDLKSFSGLKAITDERPCVEKKHDLSMDNEKIKDHLQGMQWRVVELEKACKNMQTQIAKISKTRLASPNPKSSSSNPKLLPKLCS